MLDINKPMVWTTNGNCNTDSLVLKVTWEITPQYIKCIHTYFKEEEIVRQDADVCLLKSMDIGVEQSLFA